MSVEYFLDTNVLVCTFDTAIPDKRQQARNPVDDALATCKGVGDSVTTTR